MAIGMEEYSPGLNIFQHELSTTCKPLNNRWERCYHYSRKNPGDRNMKYKEHISMAESQEQWYNRQAIERLAQHIPFEQDKASKAEFIEMLRGLVLRHGRSIDPNSFGFEARTELMRLGLWERIGQGKKTDE